MTTLSIAETAERTGVSPHTLRYYERSTGMPITGMQEYVDLIRPGPSTAPARPALLEEHRRRVLHDLEHLNDCLGAMNFKIDFYRGSTA